MRLVLVLLFLSGIILLVWSVDRSCAAIGVSLLLIGLTKDHT